ncbi:MAG TPA: response regulator transcription factor [Sporichthyaceae bacterium]|nr:response regulator transcription factor [Sporichthyaceae bacterium]
MIIGDVRVLVVEDSAAMASVIQRGLQEEGFAVDVAADGTEGLWMALEWDYDVVVLDAMLPGLDGFEVCRRMRAGRRWTPVLMLTARTSVDDRVSGLNAGADDYLVKPFALRELVARLQALLRRGATSRPTVLECGDLTLDPVSRVVSRAGTELDLTAKEFAILELFMRHPGEVLTRTRILEHVWDMAFDPSSNIVDQYIGYLRRKIDKPFGRDTLKTLRGAGYRLDPDGTC